jgi:16S rRNA (cytidine1402-2'-O)-methyltransferase
MPGTLYVVATPIGNLEDITARALRVLREVALIAAEDTRRTAHLLARYAIDTPTTSLHEHNETRKTPALIERLTRGENVALVSDAGTPLISDPGRHLIRAAIEAEIRIEPIPGPSAVMAALAVSGLSTEPFSFLGFPPTRSKDRILWFKRLGDAGQTAVFFEAPHRIRETLEQILSAIGDCQIVVCRELTKLHETLVRGPISAVLASMDAVKGELTIVIDLGRKTDIVTPKPPADADLLAELGYITENGVASRRKALNMLAKRHRLMPNEVYEAIERAKKWAK